MAFAFISQEDIDEFSPALKVILNEELEKGNTIVETWRGWPKKDTICVMLEKPFLKSYQSENIEFYDVNDVHYWKAQYDDKLTNHVLACRFEHKYNL